MPSIKKHLARKAALHLEPEPEAAASPLDYYASAEAWKPAATTTLPDLIEAIRSDEFAERVAAIREAVAAGNDETAATLKKQLPAVSLSGSIDGRRKKAMEEGRFRHSGFLQIDLDAKDHPGTSPEQMREILIGDPHIAAVFRAPSGTGVKGIARIPAVATDHKENFLAAEAHFAALGLVMDKSCKDPVRLCFVSHDPDAWIRPLSETSVLIAPPRPPQDAPADVPPPEPRHRNREETEEQYERNRPQTTEISPVTGGLIIRAARPPLDAALIADMLRHIPYPGYDGWLKITNAVWREIGVAEGTRILQQWAPEKNPGDYEKHAQHPLSEVTAGTLHFFAQQHGWTMPAPASPYVKPATKTPAPSAAAVLAKEKPASNDGIPETVFPVPAGKIGYDVSSRHIFGIIGPARRLFMRGTLVHEVAHEADGHFSLMPVNQDRFASLVETFGPKVMRLELREDGTHRWRSTTLTGAAAKILLASDGARETLPAIRQLVSAPAIIPSAEDGGTETLGQGYHTHAGGTFITSKAATPELSLDEAREAILTILHDFDFASGGDASRAIASLLSPAMKIGGWIHDDFPLDVAEADQSQAGKTYRHKLIQAIYREVPSAITQATGGVGSLDERVAAALIAGRPFIVMDNFRGRMDSQTLESALRGQGRVNARALRTNIDVDCSPFLWQLSTNGAELTRDLANRSIITRIRKRAGTHSFRTFPEGELIDHVRANQPRFLAAIHAIIREWAAQGCPRTDESRHDFRAWCRAMDWIVQNIFSFPPLLDGHREEQLRTANPKLQWLRDVINATLLDGYAGAGISASDLADIAEHHDIPLPGRRAGSSESMEVAIGKTLSRLYRDAEDETLTVDGRKFIRQITHEQDPVHRTVRERKVYVIENP